MASWAVELLKETGKTFFKMKHPQKKINSRKLKKQEKLEANHS